ncbi:MAG: hypothetical protein KKF68_00155 [Nanoarchaeota archaeon]|nr:hypothetical protein [Nanoarchaeota archaeon]
MKKERKKVKEIFKIEKKGEEKIKKTSGIEREEKIDAKKLKKQIQKENKILRNFLIVIGAIIVFIACFFFISYQIRNFEYKEVKFKIVKEKNLIFYKTSFPLYSQEGVHTADYNFFIRNDPRKLGEEVPFKGQLFLLENFVINMSEEFHCEGDGMIAIANMIKPLEVLGAKVIKDENASCDVSGRYIFLQIQSGNETEIKQVAPSCYNLYVKDCEILKVTERLMLETFIEFTKAQEKLN